MRWKPWTVTPAGVGLALSCSLSCTDHLVRPVEYGRGYGCETARMITLQTNHAVDLLFVVDDSIGMARAQARLAAAFPAVLARFEAERGEIDYRVAVTSTSREDGSCGDAPVDQLGSLASQGCLDDLEAFHGGGLDFSGACSSVCELEHLADHFVPTTTALDPTPRVRPWIERTQGALNLEAGVDPEQVFACLAPRGTSGCEYESPLEAAYQALSRTRDPEDPAHGFLRETSVLAVVFITDEVDCSFARDLALLAPRHANELAAGFGEPSPVVDAACWQAGVSCWGGPGTYEDCASEDLDQDLQPTQLEAEAMLHPISRYVDLLQSFENTRKMMYPDQEVVVGVIAGVPPGYSTEQSDSIYMDATDPAFQAAYGIGPGCTEVDGTAALPPVRLRDVADAFGEDNVHSICEDDYSDALSDIASRITAQMPPACYKECALDQDPDEPGMQVGCFVEQESLGLARSEIRPCDRVGDTLVMPDEDTHVCYGLRTDALGPDDALDRISDECRDEGWNLEFELVRRPGHPAPPLTVVTATCIPSENPTVDCPNLWG